MAESEIVTSFANPKAKVSSAQLVHNGQLGDFGFGGRQPFLAVLAVLSRSGGLTRLEFQIPPSLIAAQIRRLA